MIFNAYQDSKIGIAGISVISSGHIFAQKGRKIDRPKGRSDYLLFYIAKGKELFYLDNEIVGEEGSFIIFRPFEKQEHIYIDNKPGEFYFIHFDAPDNFDLFEFESSVLYNSKLSTAICDLFEEIIDELQKNSLPMRNYALQSYLLFSLFLKESQEKKLLQKKNILTKYLL